MEQNTKTRKTRRFNYRPLKHIRLKQKDRTVEHRKLKHITKEYKSIEHRTLDYYTNRILEYYNV